jgi:flagellar FliJ protein
MPHFRFSLDPVLRLRSQRAEAVQLEFAELEIHRVSAERRLQELREMAAARKDDLRRAQHEGRLDIDGVRRRLADLERLAAMIADQYSVLADLRVAVEAKREELLDRTREKKVLEEFRDRQQAEHRRDELLQAGKVNDDIGSTAFARARLGA